MPLYTYQCNQQQCQHTLDKLQKFSDEPLTTCPACNKESLVKQVSTGTAFCLMGDNHWSRPGMSVGNKKH
jgi:putative FmdB family regulatory protein